MWRWPVDELHGEEAKLFVDFKDGADVGVVQSGGGLGFLKEAFFHFGIVARQELQRHRPLQFLIFGFVDYAHAALAQFFEDAVVGDDLTGHV
jgi:hypothetical protein